MIATVLVGMTLSSVSFAQEIHKGACHITVKPDGGKQIDRSVDLDPEELSTSLGNIGGFEIEAYYYFDKEQNVGRAFLDVKSEGGVTQNFLGENAVTWNVYNYKKQHLIVSCSVKVK